MGKVAFVFPGQGSQVVGMGKAVHDAFDVARATFAAADSALGESLSGLCFEGPTESLKLTANTQPALLTTAIALLRALDERPDVVAGHSLGEYAANVAFVRACGAAGARTWRLHAGGGAGRAGRDGGRARW